MPSAPRCARIWRRWRSRRPEASGIALRICVIFSVISRSSLVSSRFWSICMMFSGMVPSPGFQSRFFVLANENRTQDAGHALLRQGRNPKVRKNSDVIAFVPSPSVQFQSIGTNTTASMLSRSTNPPRLTPKHAKLRPYVNDIED